MLGCDVSTWNARSDLGEWTFDLGDLEALVTSKTRLLIFNFPHNPTGYYPPDDDWQAILNLCKQRGMFIFSDEIYIGTLRHPGP